GRSALLAFLRGDIPSREKPWPALVGPVAGAMAAAAPLGALEVWARHAGGSYLERVAHHENLTFEELGPYGLWLRELFELDPLLQIAVCVVAAYTFRSPSLSRVEKSLLGLAYVVMLCLVGLALDPENPRVFISLCIFFLIAVLLWITRALEGAGPIAAAAGDETPPPSLIRAPFDCRALAASIAV